MTSLITGVHGFAGSHLVDHLLSLGEDVVGLARDPARNENNRHNLDRIKVAPCDIRDKSALLRALTEFRPDRIYHLAAISFVPQAEKSGNKAWDVNVQGTANLLEAMEAARPSARLLFAGSCEAYGPVLETDVPIKETQPLRPASKYGESKRAAEELVLAAGKRGLDVVCVRAFNHTGPRQSERFVCSSFAKQIVEAGRSGEKVLQVGNLEAGRDFTDVRDTVRAYQALMAEGAAGEVYNVCSGKAIKIQAILDRLLATSGADVEAQRDPEKYRPEPQSMVYGDPKKLQAATGWRPEIDFDTTIADLLEYWRQPA